MTEKQTLFAQVVSNTYPSCRLSVLIIKLIDCDINSERCAVFLFHFDFAPPSSGFMESLRYLRRVSRGISLTVQNRNLFPYQFLYFVFGFPASSAVRK